MGHVLPKHEEILSGGTMEIYEDTLRESPPMYGRGKDKNLRKELSIRVL